jgi:ribosomal protein S20
LAHSQRGWTGARTPSAIKRVRQTQRKRAINQPRRTAAKTLVSKALVAANDAAISGSADSHEAVAVAVQNAVSALDRAAKIGAIHRNSADRRKSRLMLKVNAALGGQGIAAPAKSARQVSKAQATKQAKARIAASRATKAKGAQTAAGKARAALAKTSRTETAAEAAAGAAEEAPAKASAAKASTTKASTTKKSTKSTTTKAASSKATGKASATKASATKASATKASTKKS